MPSDPRELTALPVVVPLAVLAFAVLLWVLHRRTALTPARAAVAVIGCLYGAGVVANTLFPIELGGSAQDLPWTVFLDLVPLSDTEPRDMLQNVVVFAPLGVLLPLVTRLDTVGRVVLAGFLLSLAMEAAQLGNAVTGHGGHIADVDDLLANTLGALLGYGAFRLARRVPALDRLARDAAWPTASRPAGRRRRTAPTTAAG